MLFWVYYIYVTRFAAMKIVSSNKENTGMTILVFQLLAITVWILWLIGIYVFVFNHHHWKDDPVKNCGPFTSSQTMESSI